MKSEEIRSLYDYNRWANRRILGAAAGLPPARFLEDRSSSFGSLRDTLVHILGAEWVWLRRWDGESPPAYPDAGDFPTVEALTSRWKELERGQSSFFDRLSDGALDRVVAYTNAAGERWRYPLRQMLQHVVNHSTYHRGQAVTLLRQLGRTPPGTDLLLYLDETTDTRA
ncbi:MAG: DinB family protein [Thermoanaerobaculia bacterium]